ncbi:MAG: formylglycine-generating enzyme family protein [Aliiglaciecola sp.]
MKKPNSLLFILAISSGLATTSFLYFEENHSANSAECKFNPGMIAIQGGTFVMGAGAAYPEEGPAHKRNIENFYISRHEVTNKEFSEFVKATNYVTVAERIPDSEHYPDVPPNMLTAGSAVFVQLDEAVTSTPFLSWWRFVEGANWRQPSGPGSNIDTKALYPVIHIALEDAMAYAKWKGHRLPTEAEYEYASRGGLESAIYQHGDSLTVNGKYQANTWQGLFPFNNSKDDGYEGLAPVGCYAANEYGTHDMIGNVWEWTQTPYYPTHDQLRLNQFKHNHAQFGFDPDQPMVPVGVIKGGSYLCSEDFCARFRPAARHSQDTGLGSSHIGFRTALDFD